MNLLMLLPLASVVVISTQQAVACKVHGTDSGVCTTKYHPSSYSADELDLDAVQQAKVQWQADMPYCGRWIASYYSPCVPSRPTKEWESSDVNFQFGRLMASETMIDVASIQTKDKWVEETVINTIQSRIEREREQGSNHYHFYENKDCEEAFARYSCWLNFPRCDEFDESLPLCQSACENLFRVCKFESDLWRCEADVVHGDSEYDIRALFPGQPFKKNEFENNDGRPKAVCTPSIKGSGSIRASILWIVAVGVVGLGLIYQSL